MLNKLGKTLLSVQILIFTASLSNAAPLGPFPRETISGHRDGNNGFSWDFNYDIEFTGDKLNIHTELQFTLGAGVNQATLDSLKPLWEQGIEGIWSNKYGVVKDGAFFFPIVFDVTYNGPVFHYTVNVAPGRSTSMTDWGTVAFPGETHGSIAAHEYGHMFGLFDEYTGGATNPAGPLIDATSIMGNTAVGAVPYARHYEDFRAWLAAKDPVEVFEIARVAEPSTVLLLGCGIALMVIRRRAGLRLR